jgi:hypothetical protein
VSWIPSDSVSGLYQAGSLIPRMPVIDLPPDVVLLVFVPPLVYSAAFHVQEAASHADPLEPPCGTSVASSGMPSRNSSFPVTAR